MTPAERILCEFGITHPKEIDLEAIAWGLGALVVYRSLDKSEATIIGSKSRAVIAVNNKVTGPRQRFSIAHEIGHWQFHRGRILFCGQKEIENPGHNPMHPEYQADTFASDLILPNYLFKPVISKVKNLTIKSAEEIGGEFDASLTATLLKVVQANQFPILAVCHSKARRRWFRRSAMVPEWWFPADQLDPESFAFDILHKGARAEKFPRKMGAGAWFDFKNVDRYEITEQSVPLPYDEVLTVLTIPDEGL